MIRIHSRVKAHKRGPGGLRPGTEVLHVVSDAENPQLQRGELIDFVHSFDLPNTRIQGILSNPHLTDKIPPHLDLWGGPGKRAEEMLESLHQSAPMEFKRYILGMGPSGPRPISQDESEIGHESAEGEKGPDDTTSGPGVHLWPVTGA